MARSVGLDKAAVVRAAAELADIHGLDALTLGLVAEQLGIRTPSLYNHVAGLAGLRRELALLCLGEVIDQLGTAVMGKSGDAAIHALAQAYRAYVLARPGLYATIIRAPEQADIELQQASARLVEIILAALSAYGLHDDDAIHAVRGLRSLVHGFATLEAASGFGLALDRDESFRRLVVMFIVGLREDKANERHGRSSHHRNC